MPEPESHPEVEELRASRARLVHAADGDRRRLERELHEGVQQHLVALAVELQLAESQAGSTPVRGCFLEEMRDVEGRRGRAQRADDPRRERDTLEYPLTG